jgi:hypothetical protein
VDLDLFVRTLWRRRLIVVAGLGGAFLLALLSYASVNPFRSPVLEHRQASRWGSTMTLQVTQLGFPEGRVDTGGTDAASSALGDPDRLITLAQLYPRLVNSDVVRKRMRKPIYGALFTRTLTTNLDDPLPLLQLTAVTADGERSLQRVRDQVRAFGAFIRANQIASEIPERKRVELRVVSGPTKPNVVTPPSKTLPVLVFLSMAIATIALVLVLENRQRVRPVRTLTSVQDVVEHAPPVEEETAQAVAATPMRGRWASVASNPAASSGTEQRAPRGLRSSRRDGAGDSNR